MLKNTLLIAFILVSLQAIFAQDATMQQKMDENGIEDVKYKSEPRDRFMFNFTFDNLIHNEENGFKTMWHSRGIGMYYMYDIPIKNSRVSIAPGIGFRHTSVYHNSFMVEDSSRISFNPIDNFIKDDNYKNHKFALNYFEIPVELRFFSKPTKNGKLIKAALGVRGSVRLNSVNKQKDKDSTGSYKIYKTKGYKEFSIFGVGPTFRIGYGGFNVFAYYNALHLFKKNAGPDMNQFSVGISITGL